jgi:ribosomal protein L7/L12
MDHLSNEIKTQIAKALDEGNKLKAVKIYMLATDSSLMESKVAVEAMMQDEENSPVKRAETTNQDLILDHIFNNRKLNAVKIYMESSGVNLMTSKEFIEELTERLRKESPEKFQPETGCLAMVLIWFALTATALAG